MKSSLRICVVISTVLVLGTSHALNYHQHPGYYSDQQWNQHQPQNHPVHQWPKTQQAAGLGPEAANNQNFQKHPIQANSHAPPIAVNVNEVPPIIDTNDSNKVFIDNETGKTETANDNPNIISKISKTEPTAASTVAKASEASIKPLATIVVSNQALDSSYPLVKSPYVFISPYQKEGNATKESSTFFTKLISYLIGKKPMNVAKIEEKTKTEFEEATDDEYLQNDDDKSETFKKGREVYRMASKTNSKVSKPLRERENKVVGDETNITKDSEENIVLTSDYASTDETKTLTPISFVTSLTRSALKGGDSLKNFFNEQKVKDFLLRLM